MKKINLNEWDRKEIYGHFEKVSNPFYMVTFTVDVTKLYDYVKENHYSFYYSFIFLCTKAINSVENFRYVIRQDEIVLIEKREPSFTDLKSDSELFHIVSVPLEETMELFNSSAKRTSQKQTCFMEQGNETDSLAYFSCIPSIRITALTNERDLNGPFEKENNIPRLSWGKFTENNNRKELNLSIEVNHRFIDGIHLAKFATQLENLIQKL